MSLLDSGLDCPLCGGRDLEIRRHYELTRDVVATLSCKCRQAEDSIAAQGRRRLHEAWLEVGHLDEDGCYKIDLTERTDKEPVKDMEQLGIDCRDCYRNAGEHDWVTEELEDEWIDGTSDSWTCRCRACDHEFSIDWPASHLAYSIVDGKRSWWS